MLQKENGKFSFENKKYEQLYQICRTEKLFYYCLITAYLHGIICIYI